MSGANGGTVIVAVHRLLLFVSHVGSKTPELASHIHSRARAGVVSEAATCSRIWIRD